MDQTADKMVDKMTKYLGPNSRHDGGQETESIMDQTADKMVDKRQKVSWTRQQTRWWTRDRKYHGPDSRQDGGQETESVMD